VGCCKTGELVVFHDLYTSGEFHRYDSGRTRVLNIYSLETLH
jgi:hypothetical protein